MANTQPVIHMAGHRDAERTQCCVRCGAVVNVGVGPFDEGALLVMPTGHYDSSYVASDDALRHGVFCEVRQRGVNKISLGGYHVEVRPSANGRAVSVLYPGLEPREYPALSEFQLIDAKALAQALREAITEAERQAA